MISATCGVTNCFNPVTTRKVDIDWCDEHEGNMKEYTISLNEYQIANLRALINAVGYPWGEVEERNPLWAANTGDWVGEVYSKLPEVDCEPNSTGHEIAQKSFSYVFPERLIVNGTIIENG